MTHDKLLTMLTEVFMLIPEKKTKEPFTGQCFGGVKTRKKIDMLALAL